ncbi:NB-ARC domain-containing protein [Streptomyces sp. NPDC005283]|uniref:ATP-binding protein n=1 Tax=Streptomyces sp. NPDC005283 TaxID=3156871 RepID=UPI003455CF71
MSAYGANGAGPDFPRSASFGGGSSLIGRRRQLAEAKRMLRHSRLVTLTGVGGVGKTKLATGVADEVRRTFPDGVWLVELGALEDEGLLPQTVATGLGLRDQSARHPSDLLCDHLRDARSLMVLDNCEHILDGCAALTDRLLRAAPGLRVLATSRQPLGVYGESVLSVPALAVPDPRRALRPEAAAHYAAVRLFQRRAAQASPGFTLGPENLDTVVRLCRRLDGIPLAIELAAAQLRTLTPQEILRRLEEHLDLSPKRSMADPARHETLRASIDWSFDLCSPGERRMWARASVFAGSCGLEAFEAVCSGDGIPEERIFDLVAGLVDKSVFIREEQGAQVRYRLLETIRQYGAERLAEAGEKTALQRRHRDWYHQLADRAEAEWLSPRQETWLARLQSEHANLRTALEFCLSEPGQAQAGLEIAASLWFHWLCSGFLSEGRHWLGRALALAPEDSVARGKALWVDGWLSVLRGDTSSALPQLEECRALALRLGDEATLVHAEQFLGGCVLYDGDFRQAIGLLEKAVAGHRAAGDRNGLMTALYQLTVACALSGDLRAADFGQDCLDLCNEAHAPWSRSYALWALGLHLWRRGEPLRAAELLRDALNTRRVVGDGWGVALCLEALAWAAASADEAERGARLLGAADVVWRSIGISRSGFRYLAEGHEKTEIRLRGELGERRYAAAVRRGARLGRDGAAEWALYGSPAPVPWPPREAVAGR